MESIKLPFRNIWRNRRRSVVTMLAVAFSCGGLAFFGGYISWTFRAVELQTIGCYGHVQIYKQGYYEHGVGDPANYAIEDYEGLKRMLLEDPILAPMLEMVSGQILFNGLVSSSETRKSSTFFGLGVVPSEDERLWKWNPYGLSPAWTYPKNDWLFGGISELADDDPDGGSLGTGLGRVLGLDSAESGAESAKTSSASPAPAPVLSGTTNPNEPSQSGSGDDVNLAFLTEEASATTATTRDASGRPQVELLVSPPEGGLPNVVSLGVRKLFPRATKELDDQLIKMPLGRASALLFPGQPVHVNTVILLLKDTKLTDAAAKRVTEIIGERKLDLEYKLWHEIRPFYHQIMRMLGVIFIFVFVLLAMLVAFTIYNTQSAGIVERMSELGTLRAIGLTRAGIWRMLILEGFFLGLFGGLLGVLFSIAGDLLLSASDVAYIPPGVSFLVKVEVLVLRNPIVMLIAFSGSLIFAVLSSALPARRAAFMPVVDALRHT